MMGIKIFLFALVVVVVAYFIFKRNVDRMDMKDKIIKFRAILKGSNQVPPVTTEAMGHASLRFNDKTKEFVLTVSYEGLVPTAAHIHQGAEGLNGPIVFPLTVTPSPIHYKSRPLTIDEEQNLKNGLYYVNLHTVAHPEGEIRGQLMH